MKSTLYLYSVIFLIFLPGGISFSAQVRAQTNLAEDVQAWFSNQAEYHEAIDQVYNFLENAINQPPPYGRISAPLANLGENPANLVSILQASMASLPDWQLSKYSTSKELVDFYLHMYPHDTACKIVPVSTPATLQEAASQILSITEEIVTLAKSVLSTEQALFLRTNHTRVTALLERFPYGAGIPQSELPVVESYIGILEQAKIEPLLCASALWDTFLGESWQENIKQLMANNDNANNKIIFQTSTPYGQIIFTGLEKNNILSGNILFIADLGGDDIYALRTQDAWSGIPQMIIDFEGNDIYESQESGGYASGIGSVSFLLDHQGNDTYHALKQTQGFGLLGVGILHDLQGDDEYNAWSMAQGVSLFGLGLLFDQAGTDRYQAAGLAQGVGMSGALGILADLSGDDVYLSTGLGPTDYGTPGLSDSWSQGIGIGLRVLSPGGVGVLQDESGSDTYTAGSLAQGGGYYYGLGLLKDNGKQDDTYLGSRYNFGWGAHVGAGYFMESGGDDHYRTRQIVSAGLAWDLAMVLFEDQDGNDLYEAGDFSLAASALHSISIFHDYSGSDTYLNAIPGQAEQVPPNLSIFLDTGIGQNYFDLLKEVSPCLVSENVSIALIVDRVNEISALQCENK